MRYAAVVLSLLMVSGCATDADGQRTGVSVADASAQVSLVAGLAVLASEAAYLEPDYLAGALIVYGLYAPLTPTWKVEVSRSGDDRLRMELRMKVLATGGEGEARRVFLRHARGLVEAGGFADFDVIHFEEGVESTRPFARRYASGEIRLVRSQIFPEL